MDFENRLHFSSFPVVLKHLCKNLLKRLVVYIRIKYLCKALQIAQQPLEFGVRCICCPVPSLWICLRCRVPTSYDADVVARLIAKDGEFSVIPKHADFGAILKDAEFGVVPKDADFGSIAKDADFGVLRKGGRRREMAKR